MFDKSALADIEVETREPSISRAKSRAFEPHRPLHVADIQLDSMEISKMPEQISVYGTSWCPDTARSRQCLARLGVNYEWYDIDKDEQARAFVEKVNSGNRSIPTIAFPDGVILVEPGDAELEEKLAETRKAG